MYNVMLTPLRNRAISTTIKSRQYGNGPLQSFSNVARGRMLIQFRNINGMPLMMPRSLDTIRAGLDFQVITFFGFRADAGNNTGLCDVTRNWKVPITGLNTGTNSGCIPRQSG